MNRTDWAALRLAFVNGSMPLAELARTFGLNEATVRSRAHRDGWQKSRNETQRAATAQAQAALTSSRADALRDFNEVDLRLAKALRSMVARRLTSAADGLLSAADLRRLASAAAEAQRIGRLALGVSTDNHGHGGPGGDGPVPLAAVPLPEYTAALQRAIEAF